MEILRLSCTYRTISAFLGNIAYGGEERRTNIGNGAGNAISNCSEAFGTPEIMATDKDSRFIWKVFQEFCTARNIILQTVIPGHHQSLGATERRHGLYREINDRVIGNWKPNSARRIEWKESAAMTMMRINSQARQFGGFKPGRRVSGRTPKMPIATEILRISRTSRIQKKHARRKLISC